MVAVNEKLMPGAGPQNLPTGNYYLLQDTLYRAAALTDSSGAVVEAYDCDAYGNTIVFTGPSADGQWFTDDDVQSNFGANDIIFCGYRLDPETENYYVRNRYYSPVLGRWLTRDPIGYQGGVNLYEYVGGDPAGNVDASGLWQQGQPIHIAGGRLASTTTNFNNQQTDTFVNEFGSESFRSVQLTPGGPRPMPVAAPPWEPNFTAWGNDAEMLEAWMTGTGRIHLNFGPNTVATEQMRQSPGVSLAIMLFYAKNHGVVCCRDLRSYTDFGYKFGLASIFRSNATEQFVGSYTVNIIPNNATGVVMVKVWNNTSLKSLLYGLGPAYQRSTFGPGGNMQQTYWWTFKYPCRK